MFGIAATFCACGGATASLKSVAPEICKFQDPNLWDCCLQLLKLMYCLVPFAVSFSQRRFLRSFFVTGRACKATQARTGACEL